MANPEHLEILKQGVEQWNKWRMGNPEVHPDLRVADLNSADLSGIYLSGSILNDVNLSAAKLREANLSGAELRRAYLMATDLSGAHLSEANLNEACLAGAQVVDAVLSWVSLRRSDLRGVNLSGTNLRGANLRDARLLGAYLGHAIFSAADLRRADFTEAHTSATSFIDLDLSGVVGLESVKHDGPSTIGIDTIYKSHGKIPEVFLRGCGVPDEFIAYIGSMVGRPIEFYSCFISYSTQDQEFAERLHADLQAKGVRCWFAPEEMKAGRKVHEQIDEAIRLHDRLLLILSEHSMKSEWVNTEIAKARKREVKDGKRVLFPVRLVGFEALRDWECFDADTGKDSAREIREYFIPDFSNWKDHDSYQTAFQRLVKDLKAKG